MLINSLKDQKNLVPVAKYPLAKYPFEFFNPVQSRVFEHYSEDCNFMIAASTSSGKTVCAELFLNYEVRVNKKKAIFLAPMKSLAQEKYDDWTNPDYVFSDLKIAICTGDYRLTQSRKKEIDSADIIIMTNETLNSLARNNNSEKSEFLEKTGLLIGDEFHGISDASRGSHQEVGLMKFVEFNPNARLVLLSATMPNVGELGGWIGNLNKKKTYVLESNYRPCPLKIHYLTYYDKLPYLDVQMEMIKEAIQVVQKHKEDKFLLFVHTKKTGEMLLERLLSAKIGCAYHNADLEKEKRVTIERKFREDPKLRCVVATSTVAAGVNMPARRVVILGVHRGISEVEVSSLLQMAGRSGRPKYDSQGDAYFLLPRSRMVEYKEKIENQTDIDSQLLDQKTLAFHLIGEIHHNNIKDEKGVKDWYSRSFANHQDKRLDENISGEVISKLKKCGAVSEWENQLSTTAIGNISSMFYFPPFDVSDLLRNFNFLFERCNEYDDYLVAYSLANIDSNRMGITNVTERDEMSKFNRQLTQLIPAKSKDFLTDGIVKIAYGYYLLLTGGGSSVFSATMRGLQIDFERIRDILIAIDGMSAKWDKREYFQRLGLRILYGVPDELVDLCKIKGIGKVKANRLWDAGLRDMELIANNLSKVAVALNCSKNVAEEVCNKARELK